QGESKKQEQRCRSYASPYDLNPKLLREKRGTPDERNNDKSELRHEQERSALEFRIKRKLRTEFFHLAEDLRLARFIFRLVKNVRNPLGNYRHFRFLHPTCGDGGGTESDPACNE